MSTLAEVEEKILALVHEQLSARDALIATLTAERDRYKAALVAVANAPGDCYCGHYAVEAGAVKP